MKRLTMFFSFIFVLGCFTSCEPEEISMDNDIVVIGETGNQEDIVDDDKN